ncbi:PD-(D/E)XK nuclease family protein [Flavobacteriales bacterium]|nr:PD-(D/E)XK nuclease family protein [Flavobacteriales bacterium]
MIAFLDKIADRLLKKFPENMEGVLVVLPSKRAVIFLKHYLSKKIKNPIFLPEFYSIEEFVERISGLTVLDNISLQFRLYKAYLNNAPKKVDSFDEFMNWSNVLLHDFNEIERGLVDAKAIYTNLKDVKELENWSVENWSFSNENLSLLQNNYVSFFESMYTWYKTFKQELLAENLAYQGLAYRNAAENIKDSTLLWEKVWFVGLNALTKSEQEIINYLKQKNIARVFWDADQFYYDNPMHEAGSFLRIQREKWKEIDFKGVGDYYANGKNNFQIIACPKNISQAKVTSELLKKLNKNDLEQSNTAIVLADESLLFPVLNNLPSEVKQLNVTMGSPLKNTTLFSFIDAIFTMQTHAFNYKKKAFYYKDIMILIEHPYFIKLTDNKTLNTFKDFIIKDNIVFVSQSNIAKYFYRQKEIFGFFNLWDTSSDAILVLEKVIKLLRKYLVEKKGTIESEVLTTFNKSLLILKQLIIESTFDIQLKTLQTVMNQLVAKEIIPFKGEPLEGVQLMGILESRTLDFKNVIMLSVNEGILPKGKSVNSFIPYDMKRYFELPTYLDSDAVFSYHFYRLLQRAENISLIYNSETDEFGSGEKSRFITQLLSEYKTSEIKSLVYKGEDLDLSSKNEIVIKNEGLDNEIKLWAKKGVSPSALNKYNNCSLSFYYYYLAKIRLDDDVDEYVDASTIGTAIHNALDSLYPLGVLTKEFIKEKTPLIIKAISDNFKKEISKEGMQEGKNYLSLQIANKLTQDFLKLEIRLLESAKKENKKINILEKEKELTYHLIVEGIEFKLIGKADRVDFKGDQLRIIDYKTGKVDPSELTFTIYNELINNPKKAKAFQLLMYAFLYLKMNPKKEVENVIAGNFSFKNIKAELIKVSKKINKTKSETLTINSLVLDDFQQQLEAVLSKIIHEDFSQTDDIKACEWCDFKSICNR